MSQTQVKNNNKKINKVRPKGQVVCILTLILEIAICICLFGIALAPVLYVLFGVTIGFFGAIGVIILTIGTVGLVWTIEGYRSFTTNFFTWIGKVMDGQDVIVNTLKGSIVWLSIILVVCASSGFIVNLIYFVKYKQNKVKFILSCIFFGLSILNMILAIFIYLNWGSK